MAAISLVNNPNPQSVRVHNLTGGTLAVGKIVGLLGWDNFSMLPGAELAGPTPENLSPMGVIGTAISDGVDGLMSLGPLMIHNIDVGAMSQGDKVYLDANGGITSAGDYYIGIVAIPGAAGSVYIFEPGMMVKE